MRTHSTSERGSLSIFFAVMGVGLLMAAGLAIDGGRKLNALGAARDLADNAARAGAQEVDQRLARETGAVVLDATAAEARALSYLASVGRTGTVAVSADTVTVTVTIDQEMVILPIGTQHVSATESARTLQEVP
jgi:Flp pilus assembly protein TadG